MYSTISGLIGNTPVLCIEKGIYAKLEYFNPAGSVKDRAVKFMLEKAEREGALTENSTVIEPTSGNTGVALAALCAAKGLRAVIVMPDNFSVERRKLVAAYGAQVVLTRGCDGMNGAIKKAVELRKSIPDSLILGQFSNPANPAAHYETTAPEIWTDMRGKVDIFVAGVGTGGTVSGVGRFLKEKNPAVKVVAVEPQGSPVLSGGCAGAHKIQGIGAGFIPDALDLSVIDEVITVSDGEAFGAAKEMAQACGLLVGVSSGAAYYAATLLAARKENADKNIVTVFPDGGERYLSIM